MSETSDAFRISLGAQIDTKNITDQIQGMKPPKITLDIDTKDLKTKIQSAVNEAYKSVGVSNIKGSKISLDTKYQKHKNRRCLCAVRLLCRRKTIR